MSGLRYAWWLFCALGAASCVRDSATEPTAPLPSPSRSSAEGSGTLRNPGRALFWSGISRRDAAPGGEVPECASVPCDRFDLTLDLPPGAWINRQGGLQVALRWSDFGNNLKLYVYREGVRIATSDGLFATAQSLLVPAPENGAYRVYIAYDFETPAELGIPAREEIPFEALAEVEYAPRPQPLRTLLPDLTSRPQRNPTFDVPPPLFFEAGVPTTSCFPSEIEEEGAQLCLRFDQVIANAGEGPLEFRFDVPADPTGTSEGPIVQRLYRSDGTVIQRTGGTWEFHPTHEHFHYTGFALSRLWSVDESGRRGSAPLRARRHSAAVSATQVRSGKKVSFCIIDFEIDAWGRKGDASRTYNAPACLIPTDEGFLRQGISAGWADVYEWLLPDQYIEASGLPDGLYILESIIDPDDTILEADERNNCGAVFVRLSGMSGPNPRANLVGPAPGCGDR